MHSYLYHVKESQQNFIVRGNFELLVMFCIVTSQLRKAEIWSNRSPCWKVPAFIFIYFSMITIYSEGWLERFCILLIIVFQWNNVISAFWSFSYLYYFVCLLRLNQFILTSLEIMWREASSKINIYWIFTYFGHGNASLINITKVNNCWTRSKALKYTCVMHLYNRWQSKLQQGTSIGSRIMLSLQYHSELYQYNSNKPTNRE